MEDWVDVVTIAQSSILRAKIDIMVARSVDGVRVVTGENGESGTMNSFILVLPV